MCNNDSYQCLAKKQQNSNYADIFLQYLAQVTSVTVEKEMDICQMNKSNSYMFIYYRIGEICE